MIEHSALPAVVDVQERPGVCAECGHEARSAEQFVGLRRLLRLPVLPARCGAESGAEEWALAGGVGAVTTCVCRDAFHAS